MLEEEEKKGGKQKYRIPKIQSTELKKVNKLKGPSEDASVPLRREKKAITSGEGRREGERKGTRKEPKEKWMGGGVGRGKPDVVLSEGKGLKT